MHIEWEIVWAIVGVVATLFTWLMTEILSARRRLKAQQSAFWNQIIDWARLVESEFETPVVRALARQALQQAGMTEAVLDAMRRQANQRIVGSLFSPKSHLSADDDRAVRGALQVPVATTRDPDLWRAVSFLQNLDRSLKAYQEARFAEGDTRIRIFFVIALTISSFAALAVRAALAAMG